jgi:hypothetical protein
MGDSVKAGFSPFHLCQGPDFEVYTQLDSGYYFPQIELIDELHEAYPNATFLLTFRNMNGWYKSVSNYQVSGNLTLREVMQKVEITGLPSGKGNSLKEFKTFFCNHIKRVRKFVQDHPSHGLIEVDIEDDASRSYMESVFSISQNCWGHSNVNVNLHPELDDVKNQSRFRW